MVELVQLTAFYSMHPLAAHGSVHMFTPAAETPHAGVPNGIHLHPDTPSGSTVTAVVTVTVGVTEGDQTVTKVEHTILYSKLNDGAGRMQQEKITKKISCFQKSICTMRRA